ncbi:MAG TPA: hypothetical protein VN253_15685 [Kofleriaceae bacterium]|nr:hypothetical protein [Kofleriaceae bacterium]
MSTTNKNETSATQPQPQPQPKPSSTPDGLPEDEIPGFPIPTSTDQGGSGTSNQ